MPSQSASRRARNERITAIQKQQQAAERKRLLMWWTVGVVVVGALVALITLSVVNKNGGNKPNQPAGALPTLSINENATKLSSGQSLSTKPGPWANPTDQTPYISAAGLQILSAEQLAVHYHAHLDIVADGKTLPVPQYIGIITSGPNTGISFLHTHDTSGVVHVEAPTNSKFTLGQVFVEWGVRLTSTCMGGYCTDATHAFKVFVNGKQYTGNPQNLVLKSLQEVALWYGDKNATPDVPKSFDFKAVGLGA